MAGKSKKFKTVLEIDVEDRTARKLRAVSRNIERMHRPVDRITRGYRNANRAMRPVTQRYEKFGASLQNAGMNAAAMGAPAALAAASGAKTAVDFEDLMNRVSSRTKDTQGVLEGEIRRLGATTLHTAYAVAEGADELSRAGLEIGDVKKSLFPVMNLATVVDKDVSTAAETITDVMAMFNFDKKAPGSAVKVADMLAYTSENSSQKYGEMIEGIKPAGGIFEATGIQLEKLLSIISVMANKGTKGSTSGTALSGAVSTLIDKKPPKETRRILGRLGPRSQYHKDDKLDLFKFLELTEKKKFSNSDFTALFGKDNGKWLFSLRGMIDEIQKTSKEIRMNSVGSTQKLASDFSKSTKQGLNQFFSAVSELGIKSFKDTGILEDFNSAVGSATSGVRLFTENVSSDALRGGMMLGGKGAAIIGGGITIGFMAKVAAKVLPGILKTVLSPWSKAYMAYEAGSFIIDQMIPTREELAGPRLTSKTHGNDPFPTHSFTDPYGKPKPTHKFVKFEDSIKAYMKTPVASKEKVQVDVNFSNVPQNTKVKTHSSKNIAIKKNIRSFKLGELNG